MREGLVAALAGVVGAPYVLTDPDRTAAYVVDWTGRFRLPPGAEAVVVRPADTAEVAAVLTTCATYGVPVVPQGGNTGLVGGGVPRSAEQVVVSLGRLAAVTDVDPSGRTLVAQAGATVAAVQRAADAHGLRYGVDLASRDTATVGGTVATDAGGLRVVRYGGTRAQVVGLQVVLSDGTVVDRLAPLPQDGAGPDLTALFVGSEGTLGVVTAARLRLVPPEHEGYVVLAGADSIAEVLELLPRQGIRAAELMRDNGVALVRRVAGLPRPLAAEHPWYLLLETDELPDLPEAVDAAVDPKLWDYRERHTESVATLAAELGQPVHKLDVSLPLSRLDEFVVALDALAGQDDVREVIVFGHVAMGNLHVNVLTGSDAVDEQVLRLVAERGGSIAAEHGVGVAKAGLLHLVRSEAEIALLHRLKDALDPHGLLNPGVLLR